MKITLLYDSSKAVEDVKTGWGFSAYVQADRNILFDTGWRGSVLLHNMKALGVNPAEVDYVVISHNHWDHMGGMTCLLNAGKQMNFFLPSSFPKHLKQEVAREHSLTEVRDVERITECVYTTGELAADYKGVPLFEQSLLLKTDEGVVVLAGCSHPGVENIIQKAKDVDDVRGFIGGMHGFEHIGILSGLDLLVPAHCTKAADAILDAYPKTAQSAGVGYTLDL